MSHHGSSHHATSTKTHSTKHKAGGGVMKTDKVGHPGSAVDNEYDHMHEFSEKVKSGKHVKEKCSGGKM